MGCEQSNTISSTQGKCNKCIVFILRLWIHLIMNCKSVTVYYNLRSLFQEVVSSCDIWTSTCMSFILLGRLPYMYMYYFKDEVFLFRGILYFSRWYLGFTKPVRATSPGSPHITLATNPGCIRNRCHYLDWICRTLRLSANLHPTNPWMKAM